MTPPSLGDIGRAGAVRALKTMGATFTVRYNFATQVKKEGRKEACGGMWIWIGWCGVDGCLGGSISRSVDGVCGGGKERSGGLGAWCVGCVDRVWGGWMPGACVGGGSMWMWI